MLPRIYRLTLKSDFENVFRNGTYHTVGSIYLKKISNNRDVSRIGIVIEKKIFKLATERNKLRRLLRESLRKKITDILPGFDIVIFYRNKEKTIDFQMLDTAVTKLFQKSNLIKRIS